MLSDPKRSTALSIAPRTWPSSATSTTRVSSSPPAPRVTVAVSPSEAASMSRAAVLAPPPAHRDAGAGYVVAIQFHLPGVEARSNLQAQRRHRCRDGGRAADRPGGPIERGEEAISHRLDLTAPVASYLRTDDLIVFRPDLLPARVAHRRGLRRRVDYVGEQHRGEEAVELRLFHPKRLQEAPDVGHEVIHGEDVVVARQLEEGGPRGVLGDVAAFLDGFDLVPGAMDHESGDLDRREDVTDVRVVHRAGAGRRVPGARREPKQLAQRAHEALVAGERR